MGKLNMNEMMTMKEYITDHCHVGMDKAIAAERFRYGNGHAIP
jgi:hypothetical protein